MSQKTECARYRFVFEEATLKVAYCQGLVITGQDLPEFVFGEEALCKELRSCSDSERKFMLAELLSEKERIRLGGIPPAETAYFFPI